MKSIEQRLTELEAKMITLENEINIKEKLPINKCLSKLKYSDLLYKTIRESGWSMREVARRCDISQSYLSLLCNGEAPPASDETNRVLGKVLSPVTDIEKDEFLIAAYLEKIPSEVLDKLLKLNLA